MTLNLEIFLFYHYLIKKKLFKILIGMSLTFAISVTLLASDIYWIVKSDLCKFPLKLKFTNRIRMILNHDLVKHVYFDDFNNSLIVIKEYVADNNCENLSKSECQQLYLHSKRYQDTELKNLVLCPDNGNFTLLLNSSTDLLQTISFDSLTEIMLVRMLKASEGWPVPHYLGHCGNVVFEEYVGDTLANIDLSSWRNKFQIAFQLLEIANKFSFSHPLYGFYFTDVTPDNIAFRKNMEGVLIDLDNVIIVDKTAKGLLAEPHTSEIFPDDNGFIFSTQDICRHAVSDHNFYAVCEHIFHKSTILGEGLLENIPHFLDKDGDLQKLVQECAFPRNLSSRFGAANLLQEKLKSTLDSTRTDGVVVIDDDYKHERKIFGQVVCSFRYGREEDEVMGLNFQKDLFLASEQVYPQNEKNIELSRLQERLMKKLGPNAIPFTFILPTSAPASVTLQPGSEDEGEPCGVQYFVKMFAGESETDRTHKRSTVALGIRKIQYAPSKQGRQPCTIVRKDFMLSPGELELEVTLDKQLYHHNEKIAVNICIRNNSNKIVKKIKAMVQQGVDVVLFQNGQYRTSVAGIETQEGCPIQPGSNLQKVIYLVPVLESNKDRRGIALDGQLKRQDTNLASSTLLASPDSRDAFGIIVSYSVKVKLYLGALGGELSAELPLVLMHPKPSNKNFTVKADSQADIETFKNETMDHEGCDAE